MKRVHVCKKDLLNFIRGHTEANKLIEKEKEERLSHLSKEESLREYNALCEFWEVSSFKELSEDFEKQKILFLIKRRGLLNRAGGLNNE